MNIRRAGTGILGSVALAVTVAACGGGQSGDAAGHPAGHAAHGGHDPSAAGGRGGSGAAGTGIVVTARSSDLGAILTDQAGRTLYAFSNDKARTSTCADQCIATWPALAGRGGPTAGAGVDRSLLGSAVRAEGSVQATYNGWPLYYYAGDAQPGDDNGQGVDGLWYAVSAKDGTQVRSSTQ